MLMTRRDILSQAATAALAAPSVFNTQPWQWIVDDEVLELRADRRRQLTVTDPDGRLLLLSCGAALHHARVAVAAAGWRPEVRRLVDAFGAVRLAQLRLGERHEVTPAHRGAAEAISRRHTDRRPFGAEPVPARLLVGLAAAAEEEGAHLHRLRRDQMPLLAIAVARANAEQMANPHYRNELMRWTNRPSWSADGVPAQTTVRRVPRRVPVRDFSLLPQTGVPVAPGGDRGAEYAILFGDADEAPHWLRAGEALSAVLLAAVAAGLRTALASEVIEVAATRQLVRRLLGGAGEPYLVFRFGLGRVPGDPAPGDLAAAPRRDPAEVIFPWGEVR